MKKQLILIGIIAMLVTVGLSGCSENNNSDTGIVSFQELLGNSTKFYGQNITMKGYINGTVYGVGNSSYNAFFYDSSSNPQYVLVLDVPSDIVIHTGMYTITGTVIKQIYATPKLTVISAVAI
ncbi:Uncharacterised protein [uncultured archaeon]|nr:Uncharacterised protein [uncultured archaeon]